MLCHLQVLQLLLERKAREARHALELSHRDAELARLQQYIDEELAELQDRQEQVSTVSLNSSTPSTGARFLHLLSPANVEAAADG